MEINEILDLRDVRNKTSRELTPPLEKIKLSVLEKFRFSLQHRLPPLPPPRRGRSPRAKKRLSPRRTRPPRSIKGSASRSRQTVPDRNTKARPDPRTTTARRYPRSRSNPSSKTGLPMPDPAGRTSSAMARRQTGAARPDASAAFSQDTASSRGCWALWCNLRPTSRRTRATRCARWCSLFWYVGR